MRTLLALVLALVAGLSSAQPWPDTVRVSVGLFATVYLAPDMGSQTLGTIPVNSLVKVPTDQIETAHTYFVRVQSGPLLGYVVTKTLKDPHSKIERFKSWQRKEYEKRTEVHRASERERKEKERQRQARLRFATSPFLNDILHERIALGMTSDMVLLSWGEPSDVNRSVGSWGVHEQWVYEDAYVYFENGVLTSWQD